MNILLQVTGSNVESVAESEVMRILILMRNFIEGYKQASAPACTASACMHALCSPVTNLTAHPPTACDQEVLILISSKGRIQALGPGHTRSSIQAGVRRMAHMAGSGWRVGHPPPDQGRI